MPIQSAWQGWQSIHGDRSHAMLGKAFGTYDPFEDPQFYQEYEFVQQMPTDENVGQFIDKYGDYLEADDYAGIFKPAEGTLPHQQYTADMTQAQLVEEEAGMQLDLIDLQGAFNEAQLAHGLEEVETDMPLIGKRAGLEGLQLERDTALTRGESDLVPRMLDLQESQLLAQTLGVELDIETTGAKLDNLNLWEDSYVSGLEADIESNLLAGGQAAFQNRVLDIKNKNFDKYAEKLTTGLDAQISAYEQQAAQAGYQTEYYDRAVELIGLELEAEKANLHAQVSQGVLHREEADRSLAIIDDVYRDKLNEIQFRAEQMGWQREEWDRQRTMWAREDAMRAQFMEEYGVPPEQADFLGVDEDVLDEPAIGEEFIVMQHPDIEGRYLARNRAGVLVDHMTGDPYVTHDEGGNPYYFVEEEDWEGNREFRPMPGDPREGEAWQGILGPGEDDFFGEDEPGIFGRGYSWAKEQLGEVFFGDEEETPEVEPEVETEVPERAEPDYDQLGDYVMGLYSSTWEIDNPSQAFEMYNNLSEGQQQELAELLSEELDMTIKPSDILGSLREM